MTMFEELVCAIRRLPPAERLRLAEHVIHEVAGEFPATGPAVTPEDEEPAELVEVGGLLIVKSDRTYPADVFDHRLVREERLSKLSSQR